jgi:hypothetical protein
MYVVTIEHSDRNTVQFTMTEEGEALARFMTECSLVAKLRAVSGGSTVITLGRKVFESIKPERICNISISMAV